MKKTTFLEKYLHLKTLTWLFSILKVNCILYIPRLTILAIGCVALWEHRGLTFSTLCEIVLSVGEFVQAMEDNKMILNDVLAFLQSSRDSMDRVKIIDVTVAFFSLKDVIASREILCKSIGDIPKTKRVKDSISASLCVGEMLDKFDSVKDPKTIPLFVTKGHGRIPSGGGFCEVAGVILGLRDELEELRMELKETRELRENDIKTLEDADAIKADICEIKRMIISRQPVTQNEDQSLNTDSVAASSTLSWAVGPVSSNRKPKKSRKRMRRESTSEVMVTSSEDEGDSTRRKRYADVAKMQSQLPGTSSSGGLRRRSPTRRSFITGLQRISGTKDCTNTSGFQGGPSCVDVYLGRCQENTTEDSIKKYCEDGGVTPRNVKKLNCSIPYSSSFKITVDSCDKDIILDGDFWLRGVIVRLFKNFQSQKKK